ncbi:MAG: polysaccharide biosynthesis tyrosine autokinase [Bythopirellula sp.]
MANNEGFGSSEIMYPAVTTAHEPSRPMMPAAPFPAQAMPGYGGPAQRGPEILTGTFNQTWLANCLRRRWLMALLLGSLIAALTGLLLLWLFPRSSSISALVHVQEETETMLDEKKGFSQQQLEVFQANQVALIKSQFVLKSALGRSDISQLEAVRKEEPDPISWLQDELQVGFSGETLVLNYDGEEDSEEMKKVLNAIIKAYEQEVVVADNLRSEEMKDSMTKMHKELSDELHDKIERYNTLSAELDGAETSIASTVLNMLLSEVRTIQDQIVEKKAELVDIAITRAVAEKQARSPAALEAAVSMGMDEDPMMANYQSEEYALMQQLRMLKSASKRGSSAQIKRLEATLRSLQQETQQYRMNTEAELRKAYKNAPNQALEAMTMEYILRRNNLTAEIAQLEAEYEEKVAEIKQKGEQSGELAMLESEIEQLDGLESEMEYKLRFWKISDEASTSDLFRVLQPAIAIDNINTIERFALASVGGIAAFCATCYGVALIEFRRRRLNGASDIDEGLGLRVLGVLPAVSSRKAMTPGSMIAAQLSESIDNVRATLMHDSTSKKRQVVLITSPATMEGTTTVASHLALSLTRAGRRTLLVDGDIREPALHKLFGLPMEEGLCEVLRTDVDVADVIRPTNTEGLWLLTAGHCDMDAIHALATDQPQPIFEKLREEFDFIIIDGAPVLGLSDSISIGQHVDGAILTVLRDHSEVRKVYQAIDLLRSMGIRLIGSVVNGVPLKADRRIAQLHKSNVKKPKKLAEAKAGSNNAAAKAAEPAAAVEDAPADKFDDIKDDINDVADLKDEIDIDFDDLGLDEKK